MTLREIVAVFEARPGVLLLVSLLPPALAAALPLLHGRKGGGSAPWRYLYSLLVYWVCVPGMLAAMLTAYSLFFTGENLLDVDVLVYVLPIVSMTVTLLLISRGVAFAEIPGFDRLSGLMTMIGATFLVLFALSRTRIWLFFGGSIAKLLVLAAFVFSLIKWGAYSAFRRGGDPRRPPPSLN